jgi:uncharacterized protein YdiU (UPF0061 family)
MLKTNPAIVPRNYILQEVIDDIEKSSMQKLDELTQAIKTPYNLDENSKKFFALRPEWAKSRAGCSALSCSS